MRRATNTHFLKKVAWNGGSLLISYALQGLHNAVGVVTDIAFENAPIATMKWTQITTLLLDIFKNLA